MKTKKIHRKLVLNKITIANLVGNDMRRIYGGAPKVTHKCVETDTCETIACETMDPELCPIPSTGSIEFSCDTACNC
ncbi:MAG: class I lanthipeptide [Candidatus Aminicenantes bacterium]|nr:MAG: class I lanthipeptide [Candidatus Aminicenantes bacterium]